MALASAFIALTKTSYIAVSAAASTPIQLTPLSANDQFSTYLVSNEGTGNVFFNLTSASTNAVAPIAGTPQQVFEILAGAAATFQGPPNAFISAITGTGTANISVTGGEGL